MAEKKRTRRTERHAQTPERVSEAAQKLQEEAAAGASARQQAAQYAAQQQYAQQMYAQQQYAQQQAAQQYAAQQYAAQQAQYVQQQQEMLQQQQMMAWEQNRQQAEKERVSSATARNGAFRGYTGTVPVMGGDSQAPRTPKKKKWPLYLLTGIVIAALAAGAVLGIQSYLKTKEIHDTVSPYDGLFVEGVYVDGISLGGMTPDQALNSVQSQIQQRNDAWLVTLSYNGTQMAQINAGMLGMSVDVGQIMNEAWAQGHTGTEAERYEAMQALKETPYEAYTATPSGDTSVIDNVLEQVKEQIDKPATDASLLAFDTSLAYPFTFQNEEYGLNLDTTELRDQLYQMVATMTSGTVELNPDKIEPNVKAVDLQKHYMLRSSVYTPISTSSTENRNNNIRRSFEFVDGYVLNAGAQFSFNSVVGERTTENGFFEAIEYAYGEHVMGVGGGVCQASTTVYQAAVCAGLQIVKREPHSDSVSYTEYGKDATVYWVGKRKIDLVFKNNTDGPLYFVASVQTDPSNKKRLIAKVSIYGEDMGDVRYEMECKTVKVLDPPEEPTYIKDKNATYVTYTDQQKSVSNAKEGYVVESYRLKYESNVLTEQTLLYTDTYSPKAERIYVGVTKRPESD